MKLADLWLGPGFWKFAYFTNDLDRGIELFRRELGVEQFETLETTWQVAMADGRSGPITGRAAFSVGRPTVAELVQPVDGLVDFWTEPLHGADGFAVVFHHVGVMLDVDEAKAVAAAHGIHPVCWSPEGADFKYAFYKPPQLGFHVEHLEPSDWLGSLATRPL
jgi:hypothetical protein